MVGARFVWFDAGHLALLAGTASVAALCIAVLRAQPRLAPVFRALLVTVLVALTAGTLALYSRHAPLEVWDVLPLHLCDFLILVAVAALATTAPLACELLYFWAGTGTVLAMLTPDLPWPAGDPRSLAYFGLHGGVVVAAAALTFGLGHVPRPGAVGRVFLLTNAYAAVVGIVDWATGMNYLYLRAKPVEPTLLDLFGPWPVYILAADVLALGLFLVLDVPFRAGRRAQRAAARASA